MYSITVSKMICHFIVSAAQYDSAMNHLGKLCSCAKNTECPGKGYPVLTYIISHQTHAMLERHNGRTA